MSMIEMNELMRALGHLEGKIDAFIQTQKEHLDRMNRIDEDVEGLDNRLRTVEKKQYGLFFAATAIWGVIQVAVGFLRH